MSKEIKIIGLDETKVEKSNKGKETMYFHIELSEPPNAKWEKLFLEKRKAFKHNLTIEFKISDKYIIMKTTENELKSYLEELENTIDNVNKEVDGLQRI